MTLDRLRDALDALGPPVTPLELAEMLWLAERLPVGEGGGAGVPPSGQYGGDHVDFRQGTFHAPVTGSMAYADVSERPGASDEGAERADPAEPQSEAGPRPAPGRRALHVPHGAPRPGTDADDVLVPAPQALRHELAIQRALRPLKRRVPDRRRRTLDEEATAARAARHPGLRLWAPVMVPVPDRLLSLALVVDTGPAMTVWRPLARELREAMQRTAAFRDVRVWQLADVGSRVGVRISAEGPALDPAALVDPTGRQIVLVLSDCSGPHWWGGRADPALHLWAGRGPTAILQPLPERLWRRTAAPAVPGRAIASRAGAPNTALRFTPHDGRAVLPAPDAIPVPVLELAPEWLADWAGLVTASGDRGRDTAVTYVSRAHPPHAQPLSSEGDLPVTERILRFQTAASPTAADLAAHVALSVPALPVMRLIQQRVTPGSRPSDLAEVLLSGLLEPVDAERGLYDFVPGARAALLETLPRPESLAVAELLGRLGAEIEARAGSGTRAFRAVVGVAEGAGSRGLGEVGQPFALVSEEALGVLRGRAIRVVERPAEVPDHETVRLPRRDEEPLPPEEAPFEPPGSVTAPTGLSNISAVDPFIGRAHELDGLDRTFTDLHGAERVVLHGVAGVGKTMLARAWAGRWGARDQERPVWWVTADSPASLVKGLSELTDVLQPFVRDARAAGGRWEWALQWLSSHTGWALVLDGVESPDDVRVLLSRLGTRGVVLITSREAEGWPDDVFRLGLGVPALSEAAQMFKVHAGREVAGVVRLCEELGRLPRAVVRAAEAIAGTGVTVDEYLALLARGALEPVEPEGEGSGSAEDLTPTDAIGDAVKESLRGIADPAAVQLLLTLAWWGDSAVPRSLLPTVLDPAYDVTRLLDVLVERGLVHLDASAATVTVPRRFGAIALTPDETLPFRGSGQVDAARHRAVSCLIAAFPAPVDDPEKWPYCRQLVPLVEGLCERARPEDDTALLAQLLTTAGEFLISQWRSESAIGMLDRAMSCRRRLSGRRSPEAVEAMKALAAAFLAARRARDAIDLLQDAMECVAARGRHLDPEALELRARLADAYAAAGDARSAVRQLEDVHTTAAVSLGVEHPETLRLRSRLAGAYVAAGRPGEAVDTYEETLTGCRRVWGGDALETMEVRTGLAFACEAAGATGRAVTELERVVASVSRVFGAGHPRAVSARLDLAGLYRAAGRVREAVETCAQAYAESLAALGADHPRALDAGERLAEMYLIDGSADRAVDLFGVVWERRRRVLGKTHPDALRAADSLASAYAGIGAVGRQTALYEGVLADWREPEAAGGGQSVELRELAHAGRARVLGEDHPDTLHALEGLALTRIRTREPETVSKGFYELSDALTTRWNTQGLFHPDTLRVLGRLVESYLEADHVEQAVQICEEARASAVRSDGPEAGATVVRHVLAHLASALGPTRSEVEVLQARLARLH
ncbi:tetratricopeptide repeat protein [Streptomyces formicae]|uniref:Tetratricopeptide repeat protein n=1 Tax=Streptomyces formicae TaxID=1616117 RepID=A0A291QJB9_9ACTN|nr:tetratricopeptide repeat protein [Streptomyces formicae]ATL31910.1 hypothetical protein KY5_6892 [Streptomyces formicae]